MACHGLPDQVRHGLPALRLDGRAPRGGSDPVWLGRASRELEANESAVAPGRAGPGRPGRGREDGADDSHRVETETGRFQARAVQICPDQARNRPASRPASLSAAPASCGGRGRGLGRSARLGSTRIDSDGPDRAGSVPPGEGGWGFGDRRPATAAVIVTCPRAPLRARRAGACGLRRVLKLFRGPGPGLPAEARRWRGYSIEASWACARAGGRLPSPPYSREEGKGELRHVHVRHGGEP